MKGCKAVRKERRLRQGREGRASGSEFRLQPYPIGSRPHAHRKVKLTPTAASLGESARPFTQVSGPPTRIQRPAPQHCRSPGPVPAEGPPDG